MHANMSDKVFENDQKNLWKTAFKKCEVMLKLTVSLQITSTNFFWPIIEYFVPCNDRTRFDLTSRDSRGGNFHDRILYHEPFNEKVKI